MFPVLSPVPSAPLEDASAEKLHNDILYYKAMLAEVARHNGSLRNLSPSMLRLRLQECENRLQRLRAGGYRR